MKSTIAILLLAVVELILLTALSVHPMPSRILRTIDLVKDADWCGNECAIGAKVGFISEHEVVITFRGREKDSSGALNDRTTFRAIFFDAETGEFKSKLQWACCSHPSTDIPQLLPIRGGGFL